MSDVNETFDDFLETVDDQNREFVIGINDYLAQSNCKCEVKSAKSGYVISYISKSNKRTLANFVCRKTGIKIRIYADHIIEYTDFLDNLPDKMKKEIKKASVCKRFVDPNDCNPKCIKGYDFLIDGERHQKCRYMAFMPTLNKENNPYIKAFLENELKAIG